MSQLLELADENRFKIRAYVHAAQTLDHLTQDLEQIVKEDRLTDMEGIGEGIAKKIRQYMTTGKMDEYEKLKGKYPLNLLELMEISGLGHKRVRFLFENLKIDSLDKLRKAASEGKLRSLEGFGPKIEENVIKGILFRDDSSKRILLWTARQISERIVSEMKQKCRSIEKIVPAGSFRRWKETVGDLDFLCVSKNPKEVIENFIHLSTAKKTLAQGKTKASIIIEEGIQCDLRVVPKESFGSALLYFTGSKEHNVALREFALQKGLTINEYGLFALSNKKKAIAGRTEEEMFKKLGLEFIPPELRENCGEIETALKKKLPKLVEEKDIRGDFHSHTNLSDGQNSLEEMAKRAKEKGWEWMITTDHSQSLKIANGLSCESLIVKKHEIARLNKKLKNFRLLLGAEIDILDQGDLDYDEISLKELDFTIASIHSGFKQTEEKITERILRAMNNPYVDVIGHLTGRLIGDREAYAVNFQKILDEALRTKTALEINGQPQRLDLYDYIAKTAGEMRIKIALSTDAHSIRQLDFMTFSLSVARRAWLTKNHILNCCTLQQLFKWKEKS